MIRRLIQLPLIIALILAATATHTRSVSADEEVWRPVDPAHLALKSAVVEPNADAEAIFWDVRIDDGGSSDLVLNHYVRIKIFTERGRDKHSAVDIPYTNDIKIKDIAARTIKSDGTIVELAKQDIIEKMMVKVSGYKIRTKTFALPGIETGAIIEYKFKEVISDSSAHNMRLQFQRDIPVQSITYRIKPSNKASFDVRSFNMPQISFEKEKDGFHAATVTRMPAFREEPMMPPEDNVRAWALVRYAATFEFTANYTFLANRIYHGFQPFMKVDEEITKKAAELVAGANTSQEKLERIYEFCRTNIKNTSLKSSGYTEEQIERLKENKKPSDTLRRGVGPAVDINLLFAALATAAGFETRVALLPDRGKRLFDRHEVVPGVLQPACIAVKDGQSWKLFDPGLKYIAPGMLRWQEEGVDGLIADAYPKWMKTPLSPPEKSKEKRTGTFTLDENGTLEGDVTIEYTGHLAVERKINNGEDSPVQREENLKESVKGRLSSAELTNIVIENADHDVKPFVSKFHVRVPEYAQRTGKRLFIQPGFFNKGIDSLFSSATRRYPVYFHYPWSEEDRITIKLPKGYTLDSADRPAAIAAGTICKHEIYMGVTKDQTTLHYNRNFFFGGDNTILFPVTSYEQLKLLFDDIHKADNHMITLKSDR